MAILTFGHFQTNLYTGFISSNCSTSKNISTLLTTFSTFYLQTGHGLFTFSFFMFISRILFLVNFTNDFQIMYSYQLYLGNFICTFHQKLYILSHFELISNLGFYLTIQNNTFNFTISSQRRSEIAVPLICEKVHCPVF